MTDTSMLMGMPSQPVPIAQVVNDYMAIEDAMQTSVPEMTVSARDALLADGPPLATARMVQQANIESAVVADHPLLNAPDAITAAQAITGSDVLDGKLATRAAVVDMYSQRVPEGHAASQIDFAKMQALADSGLLTGKTRDLWSSYIAGDIPEDKALELLDVVQQLGDGTSSRTKPEWADVAGVDFDDTGVTIRTKPTEIGPKEIAAFKGSVNTSLPIPSVVSPELQIAVSPDGSTVATGVVDVANATKLRHMYPCVTDGSAAVWAQSAPQTVTDLQGLQDHMAVQNSSEGDLVDALALRRSGGYWGHRPGNFVVFEADAPPRGVEAQSLGNVRTLAPEKSLQKLNPQKLNPDNLDAHDGPLATSAWAVLPMSSQRSVRAAGFKPVNQGDSILVFGMTAREAMSHTKGEIVTQDGVWVNGEQQPDPEDRTYRAAIGGRAVEWDPRSFGTMDSDDSETEVRRAPSLSRRWLVEIPEGDVAAKAEQLELMGGKNVSVYSHSMPDGWAPVREHSYTDGQGLYLHRTRDGELTSPHGTTVFVRPERAEALPPASAPPPETFEVRRPGELVVNGAAIVNAGQVDQPRPEFWKLTREGQRPSAVSVDTSTAVPTVTPIFGEATIQASTGKLENGKVVFKVDGTDVAEVVRAGNVLSRIGVPRSKIEIRSADRVFTLG